MEFAEFFAPFHNQARFRSAFVGWFWAVSERTCKPVWRKQRSDG